MIRALGESDSFAPYVSTTAEYFQSCFLHFNKQNVFIELVFIFVKLCLKNLILRL